MDLEAQASFLPMSGMASRVGVTRLHPAEFMLNIQPISILQNMIDSQIVALGSQPQQKLEIDTAPGAFGF